MKMAAKQKKQAPLINRRELIELHEYQLTNWRIANYQLRTAD